MLKSIFSVIIRHRSHDEKTTQHIYIFLNKLLTSLGKKQNGSGWEVKKKVEVARQKEAKFVGSSKRY